MDPPLDPSVLGLLGVLKSFVFRDNPSKPFVFNNILGII